MAFHETLFPLSIGLGATGGPERRTEIVTLSSGHEVRNSRWAHSRRRYDVGTGVTSVDDLYQIVAFFEERQGRLHGFRFRDASDFTSTTPKADPTPLDQALGTGDGLTSTFQLSKAYGGSFGGYQRPIYKPVSGSVRIAFDDVEQSGGFTVDVTTGIVSFASPPLAGVRLTGGFLFDVPVRFEMDQLNVDLSAFNAGHYPSISLLEVRQ